MWDGEIPDPMVHPYDRACSDVRTRLFEHDAREWFNTQSPLLKSIHEFSTPESEQIVDEIYARGADSVFVLGDEDTIQRGGSIDMLLIELPMDRHSRVQLYDLNQMVAEETGFDGDIDERPKVHAPSMDLTHHDHRTKRMHARQACACLQKRSITRPTTSRQAV